MSMDELHYPLFTTDLIVNAMNTYRERPLFLIEGGDMLTVGDVADATSRFVQALDEMGIGKGTRVALIAPNRPECLFVMNTLQILNAIYVPMHPLAGFPDHLNVLESAEVDTLIFDPEAFEDHARKLAEAKPGLRLLSFGSSELGEDIFKLSDKFTPQKLVAPKVGPHDIMRMGFSGGTTGKPKSLPSCQRTGAATMQIMMSEWEWPKNPRTLSCAPLTHAGGAMFAPMLLRGGTMLVQPRFDPEKVMQAIQDHKINCMLLVPTMIYALLDHPRFDEFDLSSLETIFYGASSISPARLKEAIERIGPVFSQFYGQAEAPMGITMLRKADHDPSNMLRMASCGRPLPWNHMQLQDDQGNEVPDGEPGEICVRGPFIMDGYGGDPELTVEAFRGGWLHTGDVAVKDPDGFYRIVDRTKDMIVSGGFNIYPRYIEDILTTHNQIAQAAVIGVPDEKWGEAVKAIVVLRAGAEVAADELIKMVGDAKGRYYAPKTVDFVEAIPMTPLGKPDKKALRALYR